jgi:hypothetical protein
VFLFGSARPSHRRTANPLNSDGTSTVAAFYAVAVSRPDAVPNLPTTTGVRNCNTADTRSELMAEVLNKSEIAELGREGSTKRIGRPSGKSMNFDRWEFRLTLRAAAERSLILKSIELQRSIASSAGGKSSRAAPHRHGGKAPPQFLPDRHSVPGELAAGKWRRSAGCARGRRCGGWRG